MRTAQKQVRQRVRLVAGGETTELWVTFDVVGESAAANEPGELEFVNALDEREQVEVMLMQEEIEEIERVVGRTLGRAGAGEDWDDKTVVEVVVVGRRF